MKIASYGWVAFVASTLWATAFAAGDEPVHATVLLKGGTLYDGTGGDPVVGDVAIAKGRIVAVGTFPLGSADLTLDCGGLVITPGFIDLHNHSDSQVVDPLTRGNVNFLMQGCTTVVTGNCGSGPVNAGEYHRKIDAAGAGTNVAHLLPQGSLRDAVMGTANRAPTPEELARMRELAEAAMRDGVWGMSTGLIYVPSSYADTGEITSIAKVVAAHGGIYASHIRGEGVNLLASVGEALKIGKDAGLPVHVSHFKASGRDAWGLIRQAVEQIEAARNQGQKVTADQYPYIASSTSLEATLIPTWARAGGQPELLKRLQNEETGKRIRGEMQRSLELADEGKRIVLARYAPKQAWVGKNLHEIAESEGVTPLDAALTITRSGGAAVVNFNMDEDDVRFAMRLPWVATASDGRAYIPNADRPHPRSYGTFSRKIGLYSIEEKTLPPAQAIRSASGLPADILGLPERGYLKAGFFADIAVFDPKSFRDEATFADPHRYSRGLRYVFVNGTPAVYQGQPTGALAGRALVKTARPSMP
ncbi:MAG: D-aminoacylase [Planctomycetaceae bacterium]|nr:D-aminoacylase [Planctomycetaceae bacterium]